MEIILVCTMERWEGKLTGGAIPAMYQKLPLNNKPVLQLLETRVSKSGANARVR